MEKKDDLCFFMRRRPESQKKTAWPLSHAAKLKMSRDKLLKNIRMP
jgi:hypothetical protein